MVIQVRHKPWDSEAIQWTGKNLEEVMKFIESPFKYEPNTCYCNKKFVYNSNTNELALVCMMTPIDLSIGDYIVRTPAGTYGPVAKEGFLNDFEVLE